MVAQQLGHREGGKARDERFALTEYITAANDRRDGRRVGRRAADAKPFELLDERCFRKPRGRAGFVALRIGLDQRDGGVAVPMNAIADLGLRQNRFLFLELRRRIVAALDVRTAESGELDRFAARRQDGGFAAGGLRGPS
jgi:hypothetical protein